MDIGPINPGNAEPWASTKLKLAVVLDVMWLFRMRWPFGSIHVVTSEVVVPLIVMPCIPVCGSGKVDDPDVPDVGRASADVSIVKSTAALLVVSTTAALTPCNDSSRRYLLLLVTWMGPLPRGLAWS